MKEWFKTALSRVTDKRVIIPVAVTAITAAVVSALLNPPTVDVDVFIKDESAE